VKKQSLQTLPTELVIPTQEDLKFDLRTRCREAVRAAIQLALDEALEQLIGAQPNERSESRTDVRNGSYSRSITTSLGEVEVDVGRSRSSGSATAPIGRYKRRTEEVDDAMTEAYVRGVSTRDMAGVTEALLGTSVGRSTVSRVTKRLDERVEALRNARLDEPFHYLYLDATFLDARWARSVENVSALVAYGVGVDGRRHLLGVLIGPQESEDTWAELLRQLIDRGLTGVRLVIADDHSGLRNAVRKALPEAKQQRCTVHLMRNVLSNVPLRHQKRLAREVSAVLHAVDLVTAKAMLERFRERMTKQFPEAVECLARGFAAGTIYFAFPKSHWIRIRSTNGLERLHGEIKRRTRAIGAFPDRASALRLVTAVATQVTSLWADRRYLDMSELDNRTNHRAA
jgi:transposase-like protein